MDSGVNDAEVGQGRERKPEKEALTDLYLPEDDPLSGFAFPGKRVISEEMRPMVMAIMDAIRARSERSSDFAIVAGGGGFRCHRMPTWKGDYYIVRRIPETVPSLTECGFGASMRKIMLSERLRKGGIIMVTGLPGNGKSTSSASIIVERLRKWGGICLSVEDPVEMPLQGVYGNGMCLQRNVDVKEAFSDALRDTMRGYPVHSDSMILIGEVRDPKTAALALQASVDGRLVIMTMHAGSLVQAIQRMIVLAGHEMGPETSRELLAGGFRMLIQQKLDKGDRGLKFSPDMLAGRPDNGLVHTLRYSFLVDSDQAVAAIRSKGAHAGMIVDEARLQRTKMRSKKDIELRKLAK